MAKLSLPKGDTIVKTLLVGLVFLYLITNIINLNAIGKSGTCSNNAYTTKTTCEGASAVWTSPQVFKEDVDYGALVPGTYVWLIVAMAVWLAWIVVTKYSGGVLNRRAIISLVLLGIGLYYLYTGVLQPLIDTLPDLSFAAYQLQAISPSGLQSILG